MTPPHHDIGPAGTEPVRLSSTFGPVIRTAFGLIGAGIIFLVFHELGRGLWPINLTTPFFAVIVWGGCFVGGSMLISALVGDEMIVTVGDKTIEIERKSPWRRSIKVLSPGDVIAVSVREHEWSEGAPTYRVALTLLSGEQFECPDMGVRVRAETLEARIRKMNGL